MDLKEIAVVQLQGLILQRRVGTFPAFPRNTAVQLQGPPAVQLQGPPVVHRRGGGGAREIWVAPTPHPHLSHGALLFPKFDAYIVRGPHFDCTRSHQGGVLRFPLVLLL